MRFALMFRNGEGGIYLPKKGAVGPFAIEALELAMAGLTFPFEVSGGAERFSRRRCSFRRLEISLAEQDVEARVSHALAPSGIRLVNLRLEEGGGHLTMELPDPLSHAQASPEDLSLLVRQPARVTCKVGLSVALPAQLALTLYDFRTFGWLPVPAAALAPRILEMLRPYPAPPQLLPWPSSLPQPEQPSSFLLRGCTTALIAPIHMFFRQIMPDLGWRIPRIADCWIEEATFQTGSLRLVASTSHSTRQASPSSPLSTSCLEAQEAGRIFAAAESALQQGDYRKAADQYGRYAESSHHPFAVTRLLDLYCSMPALSAEAEELALELLKEKPDFIPALNALAVVALFQGDRKEGAQQYIRMAQALDREGDHHDRIEALLMAAQLLDETEPDRAAPLLEEVIRLRRADLKLLRSLAALYGRLGRQEDQIRVLRRTLATSQSREDQVWAHLQLGIIQRDSLGDLAESTRHFERAHRLDEARTEALEELAQVHRLQGDGTRAIRILERLAERERASGHLTAAAALLTRVGLLWKDDLHRLDTALIVFLEAADLADHPDALLHAVSIRRQQGALVEAIILQERLVASLKGQPEDRLPDLQSAVASLARDLISLDRCPEALLHLDGLSTGPFSSPDLLWVRAEACERLEQWEKVVETYRRLIALQGHEGSRDIWIKLADIYDRKLGLVGEAVRSLERARVIYPQDPTILQILAGLYKRTERWTAWEEALSSLAECTEGEARVLALEELGQARWHFLSDPRGAIQALRSALALRPLREESLRALADLYRLVDQKLALAETLESLASVVDQRGAREEAASLYREAGELLLALGRAEQGAYLLRQALDHGFHKAEVASKLADALIQTSRFQEAERVIQGLMTGAEDDDRVQYLITLGDIARAQGRSQDSLALWRQALTLKPDLMAIYDRIADLHRQTGRWGPLAGVLKEMATALPPLHAAPALIEAAEILHEKLDRKGEAISLATQAVSLTRASQAEGDERAALILLEALIEPRNPQKLAVLVRLGDLEPLPEAKASRFLEAANEAEHRGDVSETVQLLRRALAAHERSEEALIRLGRYHLGRQEWPEAIRLLKRPIQMRIAEGRPLPPELYLDLGRALIGSKQIMVAEKILRPLLQDPRAAQVARPLLKDLFHSLGRWSDLADLLEQDLALARQSGDPAAVEMSLLALAEALLAADRGSEAFEALEETLSIAPTSVHALRLHARAAQACHSLEAAVASLESLSRLAATPEEVLASLSLAGRIILEQGGDLHHGRALIDRALEISPSDADLLSLAQEVRKQLGDWEGVTHLLQQRAMGASDTSLAAQWLLEAAIILSDQLHRTEEALDLVAQARTLDGEGDLPERASRMHLSLLEALERWEEVLGHLQERKAKANDQAEAVDLTMRQAFILKYNLGRPEDALICYQEVESLEPMNIEALKALVDEACPSEQRRERLNRLMEALANRGQREEAAEVALTLLDQAWQGERISDISSLIAFLARLAPHQPSTLLAQARLASLTRDQALAKRVIQHASPLIGPASAWACPLLEALAPLVKPGPELHAFLARLLEVDLLDDKMIVPLAQAAEDRQDYPSLVMLLEMLLPLQEDQEALLELRLELAQLCLSRLNDPLRAREHLSNVLMAQPSREEALLSLARIMEEEQAWPDLMALLEAAAQDPDLSQDRLPSLFLAMAQVALDHLDDGARAASLYLQALELGVGKEALEGIRRATRVTGDMEARLQALQRAQELTSNHDDAVALTIEEARIWHQFMNDPDRALEVLSQERLWGAVPNRDIIIEAFGLLETLGRWREAAALGRDLIDLSSPEEQQRNVLRAGRAIEGTGRIRDAANLYLEAAHGQDRPMAEEALRRAELILESLGDSTKLAEAYGLHLELVDDPRSRASILTSLADVLSRAARTDEAERASLEAEEILRRLEEEPS